MMEMEKKTPKSPRTRQRESRERKRLQSEDYDKYKEKDAKRKKLSRNNEKKERIPEGIKQHRSYLNRQRVMRAKKAASKTTIFVWSSLG